MRLKVPQGYWAVGGGMLHLCLSDFCRTAEIKQLLIHATLCCGHWQAHCCCCQLGCTCDGMYNFKCCCSLPKPYAEGLSAWQWLGPTQIGQLVSVVSSQVQLPQNIRQAQGRLT